MWLAYVDVHSSIKMRRQSKHVSVNLTIRLIEVQFNKRTRLYIRLDHDWIHEIDFTNKVNIYIYLHIYIDHRKIKKHLLILKTPCILVCTNFYSLKIRTCLHLYVLFLRFLFCEKNWRLSYTSYKSCSCRYVYCTIWNLLYLFVAMYKYLVHFFSSLMLLFVIVWIVPL